MTTMTLYETTDALAQVRAWLEESEGEWSPEIEALMELAEGNFVQKVERVALFVRDRLALAKMNKEAGEYHTKRAKSFTTAAESLKAYLERELEKAGKDRVDAPLVTVAIQLNPPSVQASVDWDEEALRGMAMYAPDFVTRKPETFALNKVALLDAAKAGGELPEGIAIVRTSSLRIR